MGSEPAEVRRLAAVLSYKKDTVVRHDVLTRHSGRITLFALDAGQEWRGEGLGGDSMIAGLEGEAAVELTGAPHVLRAGEMLTVPAGIAPTVRATIPFKMMLVVIEGQEPDTGEADPE